MGAPVDKQDNDGIRPLHLASKQQNEKLKIFSNPIHKIVNDDTLIIIFDSTLFDYDNLDVNLDVDIEQIPQKCIIN